MNRTAVESSNIAAVGYDPAVQVLEVEFKNGGLYQYAFVSSELHAELMRAESLGGFLHAKVKPATQFRKVEPAP